MTPAEQRGGHRAVTPFRPTEVRVDGSPMAEPAVCYCCGRRPSSIGIGQRRPNGDPLLLCDLCWMIVDNIRAATSFDLYELNAVDKAGARAGAYLERIGKFSLAELTPGEWNYFLREVIEGFGAELRREIAEGVPF